jgi:hypothetical protein
VCRFYIAAGNEATRQNKFSGVVAKSASNNLQKLFLSPTSRLNFGFITGGKLTAVLFTPFSWGSNWFAIRCINYSRITLEAGMVMKKAFGDDSPLRQGAGKSFWILLNSSR